MTRKQSSQRLNYAMKRWCHRCFNVFVHQFLQMFFFGDEKNEKEKKKQQIFCKRLLNIIFKKIKIIIE